MKSTQRKGVERVGKHLRAPGPPPPARRRAGSGGPSLGGLAGGADGDGFHTEFGGHLNGEQEEAGWFDQTNRPIEPAAKQNPSEPPPPPRQYLPKKREVPLGRTARTQVGDSPTTRRSKLLTREPRLGLLHKQ